MAIVVKPEIRNFYQATDILQKLARKPNLNDYEKILLENAKKFLNEELSCPLCKKKFKSVDALIQHKRNKKHKEKLEIVVQESPEFGFMKAFAIKLELTIKPNLTGDEKILLEKAQKSLDIHSNNTRKHANKRFGLPEDTPHDVTWKMLVEESQRKREESQRKKNEIDKRNKEFNMQMRASNRQIRVKEKKLKEEQERIRKELLKKDVEEWNEWKANHPDFNIPVFHEENKELPSCPKKCERPLWPWFKRNKNKLLDMTTG